MDTNKMREQFEEAWCYAMRNDEGVPAARPLRSLIDPEKYRGSGVNGAWYWWQASREAVVVEMPSRASEASREYFDDVEGGSFNEAAYIRDVRKAIEAQGLKVAP